MHFMDVDSLDESRSCFLQRNLSFSKCVSSFFLTYGITSNNDMALALLKVAGNRKLAIGKDISLITFDDSQWAAAMAPGLTVVARPVEELGSLAIEKLVAEIKQPGQAAEKIVLPTELIARGSVANLVMYPENDPENY